MYVGKIRKSRDCQFAKGKLPDQARVELSNYRPMLWTRRRQRRRNEGIQDNAQNANNNNRRDGDNNGGQGNREERNDRV